MQPTMLSNKLRRSTEDDRDGLRQLSEMLMRYRPMFLKQK